MANWFRKLLHEHEWVHLQTTHIPGDDYTDCGIHVTIVPRTVYFRECKSCPAWQQYYPKRKPPDGSGMGVGWPNDVW